MAIFTKPRAKGGVDVVGTKISCRYEGQAVEGIVKSQSKVEGEGNVLVVETTAGVASIVFEKATEVWFTLLDSDPRKPIGNTDDGYDAMRDNYNTKYGYGAWKNRRR